MFRLACPGCGADHDVSDLPLQRAPDMELEPWEGASPDDG